MSSDALMNRLYSIKGHVLASIILCRILSDYVTYILGKARAPLRANETHVIKSPTLQATSRHTLVR